MECLIYTSILFMFKSGYNAIKEGVLFTLSPTGPGSPASPGNPGIPVGPWEEDSYSWAEHYVSSHHTREHVFSSCKKSKRGWKEFRNSFFLYRFTPEKKKKNSWERLHLLCHQFHLCSPEEKTEIEKKSIILSFDLSDWHTQKKRADHSYDVLKLERHIGSSCFGYCR